MKRSQKFEKDLTYNERYQVNRERGLREGRLIGVRDILIRVLKISARDNNRKPNKDVLRKIRYETDSAYIEKLMYMAITDDIGARYVEMYYDEIFRTEKEIETEEYTIYKKDDEDD